ncbi:hypothetical protein A5719_07835 [Mycolicibacterium peregrinum]|nr:hypothetical protein A5719_07835 [Mycolicibacterium peregrinum]
MVDDVLPARFGLVGFLTQVFPTAGPVLVAPLTPAPALGFAVVPSPDCDGLVELDVDESEEDEPVVSAAATP